MNGLGECVFRDGVKEGLQKGLEKGIRAIILENVEEAVPRDQILQKLQKHFELTDTEAKEYYRRFALNE